MEAASRLLGANKKGVEPSSTVMIVIAAVILLAILILLVLFFQQKVGGSGIFEYATNWKGFKWS